MRKQFVTTVEAALARDERLALLLGDIGVWGFNKAFGAFPERVYNIGILEQSTVSVAAGLAMTGFIPIVHTITPFIIERAYEQIKLDFGYQRLGGNFVSVGASYDYAALGCTHHCPGDVNALSQIPGMEIVLPGTPQEFDRLFNQAYANGHPTYFRLSEQSNATSVEVEFGKAAVIKKGSQATVIAVGTGLNIVLEAVADLDVTVLYYTTVAPFDAATLQATVGNGKIVICEPYYSGAVATHVLKALPGERLAIEMVGVPLQFLTNYGRAQEHHQAIGFTAENVRAKLMALIGK